MTIKAMKNMGAAAAIAAVLTASAVQAGAVTKEEFEQARTIAAAAYVRYTDPGSGYLDGKSPKTMSELEALVKPHDKDMQLLQDFKSKPTASDYATWTKADLKAYWSNTFFQGSGLSTEAASGRKAKIQAGIGAMKVTDPAPVQEEPSAPVRDTVADNSQPQSQYPDELTSPQPVTVTEEITDTVTTEETTATHDESSGSSTWLYVVILAILVIIVIVLVVFAARMMKKPAQGQTEEADYEPQPVAPQRPAPAPRRPVQPRENPQPNVAPQTADDPRERLSSLSMHNEQLNSKIVEVERENRRLREELEQARMEARRREEAVVVPEAASAPVSQPAVGRERIIYLGRANKDKIFVRADRDFTPEKSIFKLVTSNGLTGTYYVVPQPQAIQWISADPHHALDNGAEVATYVTAAGMTAVVTDTAGTAIFEDGCWKVLRPAAVHFE